MPATPRTISIVQLYVRRDQMMANLRSIRSFDASVGMLSLEDRARYFDELEQVEQAEQAADLLAVWTACLEREAADLDLSDADDRATFRGRVSSAFANAKIDVVQQVAAGLGIDAKRDRAAACRVVADELIRRAVSRTTNTRPLTAEQTKTLRMIWEMCRANGGSTRLSRQPTSLVNRGLVKRCDGAGLVRWHMTAEGTALAEQAEQARVATRASRVSALAAAVLVAVAACDAAEVDGFTAPPAAGITSAASTDAPPAQHGTSSDETGDAPDADASSSSTGTAGSTGSSTGEPSTTTAAVDATTTSGGDDTTGADTTGEPDPSTTGADTTTTDPSTGEASTGTGDASTGDASTTSTTGGDTTTADDEGTSTSSTGEPPPPPPLELPPECMGYTPLTDANRNVAFGIAGPKSCDAQLAPGWYRFMGAAGSRMPTTPPPIFSCGTHAGGYMNGKHPAADDGIVETTACFHWADNGKDYPCFGGPKPLKVLNCGEFYVYHLTPSAACMSRFCGEDV